MLNFASFKSRVISLPRIYMLALLFLAHPAHAESYPDHPIRLIVPFSAGSASDIYARLIGQKLNEILGQPVIVEDHAGAGGLIGSKLVANAKPDGYTILIAGFPWAIAPCFYKEKPYDTFRDFSLIGSIGTLPSVLVVSRKSPITDLKSLIAMARKSPGKLSFASSGTGTPSSLVMASFMATAHIKLQEIPYKSSAQALQDTIAGTVAMNLPALSPALPSLASGNVRGLAVTSLKRSNAAPSIPTIAESGFPGFNGAQWLGLVTTAGTPPKVIAKLNQALNKALAMPDLAEKIEKNGVIVNPLSLGQFTIFVKKDTAKWEALIKKLKIPPQ